VLLETPLAVSLSRMIPAMLGLKTLVGSFFSLVFVFSPLLFFFFLSSFLFLVGARDHALRQPRVRYFNAVGGVVACFRDDCACTEGFD